MRKRRKARPASANRTPRRRQRRPDRDLAVVRSGGLDFDDSTIVAGAAAMLRNGCDYNAVALATAAVYNHPFMTRVERAAWRTLIGSGLRAASVAEDQTFRQRLRACGDRLIAVHPDLEPEIRTAWQAFAIDPNALPDATAVMPSTTANLALPELIGIPPVVDLIAVMTESWHRLRRMVEEDPDWYDRACAGPTDLA